MTKKQIERLKTKIERSRITYMKSLFELYKPIIKKIQKLGIKDPDDFNKKFISRSQLKQDYMRKSDVGKYILSNKNKFLKFLKDHENDNR